MFHSEFGQDRFVAQRLPKREGVFVEFGALDGVLHSNTLFLQQYLGWDGLLIEPNPDAFSRLLVNRPKQKLLNAAVYDRDGMVEFEKISGGLYGWSGIRETIEEPHRARITANVPDTSIERITVPAINLNDALTKFSITHIDYLSIDVEGAELKILSVFPFEKFSIDILGVEDNFGNQELDNLIQSKGFRFLGKCGPDRMYQYSV